MKVRYIIFFLLLCLNWIHTQPQILDPAKIWEIEGYDKGEIPTTMDMTPEEDLIINMYLTPQNAWNDQDAIKMHEILPFGKEGAYRISAMLFLMIAMNPELKEKIEKRIQSFLNYLKEKREVEYDTIKHEYKTVGGFAITFSDAKKYYEEALQYKMSEFDIKFVDYKEKEKFRKMLYLYFTDPTEANYKNIQNYLQSLYKTDLINFCARITYLNEISDKFTKKLIKNLKLN